jgi:hypothetical protein
VLHKRSFTAASLAIVCAIACAPVSDNRLHDDESAGFRTALVLPLNVMAAMPEEFRGREELVEAALHDYLRDQGRRVETISYADARRAWNASARDCERQQAQGCVGFEGAARLLALALREGSDHELLIVPYLRFRLAENCTEHVHWDGVERPVERTGAGLSPDGPVAIRHIEMRAVSLEIVALTRDGEKAFEGDGGLEVVDRLRATGGDEVIVAEPRDDLFENPGWLREGVAVALDPLVPQRDGG